MGAGALLLIVIGFIVTQKYLRKEKAQSVAARGASSSPSSSEVATEFDLTLEGQLDRIEADGGHTPDAVLNNWNTSLPDVKYSALEKDTSQFAGKAYAFYAKILQIHERDGFTQARVHYGDDAEAIFWVEGRFSTPYLKGQYVNIIGYLAGANSYESEAGWKITIPAFAARAIFSDKDRRPYDDFYKAKYGTTIVRRPKASQ